MVGSSGGSGGGMGAPGPGTIGSGGPMKKTVKSVLGVDKKSTKKYKQRKKY